MFNERNISWIKLQNRLGFQAEKNEKEVKHIFIFSEIARWCRFSCCRFGGELAGGEVGENEF